jgi:hypothetical protein
MGGARINPPGTAGAPGAPGAPGAAGPSLIFGDGSDGDLVFDGNPVVLAAHGVTLTVVGSTYTATRPIMADDMSVSAGIILVMASYPLFVKGTLTNNGTIHNNGSSGASGAAGGAGGAAGPSAFYRPGWGGGNGNQGAGSTGQVSPDSCANNDAGTLIYSGAGGAGNGVSGGVARTCTAMVQKQGGPGFQKLPWNWMAPCALTAEAGPTPASGGAGGSGGGGDNVAKKGGGGGAGGGILAIAAKVIDVPMGSGFTAQGGRGGDGDGTGALATGGGGGGTGGEIIIYSTTSANLGVCSATGGAGGSGQNGGGNGGIGNDGAVRWIQI